MAGGEIPRFPGMDELIKAAVPRGSFEDIKEIKGTPVPGDTVLQNIRDSAAFDLPIFQKQEARSGSLIFVAGGPTLLEFIDEIRARKAAGEFVMTSNNTHDFLVSNGIVPDACLLFDPKKRVAGYITKPQKITRYFLGVTVVKELFEAFAGYDVTKVLIAYGLESEEDLKLQAELYPEIKPYNYLVGGTMTPLRAMPFACMFGFKTIEYYGMDSCFSARQPKLVMDDDDDYNKALQRIGRCYQDTQTGRMYVIDEPSDGGYFYAYKKDRQEDVHIAEIGDRRFMTSPGFSWQAKQLVYWMDRLEGKIDVIVHGDSLTFALVDADRKRKEFIRKKIGDRRWSDDYAKMQRAMHEDDNYGTKGSRNFEIVSRALLGLYGQLRRTVKWMDYGCGTGDLCNAVEEAFRFVDIRRYDPFHPFWRDLPDPDAQDFVTCFDVMEHVEEECVENTLDFIAKRARLGVMFGISCHEAMKTLPDGRNAHITIKTPSWWRDKLSKRFGIAEQSNTKYGVIFLCTAIGAVESIESERKAA